MYLVWFSYSINFNLYTIYIYGVLKVSIEYTALFHASYNMINSKFYYIIVTKWLIQKFRCFAVATKVYKKTFLGQFPTL